MPRAAARLDAVASRSQLDIVVEYLPSGLHRVFKQPAPHFSDQGATAVNNSRRMLFAGLAGMFVPRLAISGPKDWLNGVRVGMLLPGHDAVVVQGAWRTDAPLTLVDFWATWCAPCIAAIPELNAMAERFATRGLQLIGVTAEEPDVALPVVQRKGMRYAVVAGGREPLSATLKIRALPYALFVDASGVIMWRGSPDKIDDALIESLLAKAEAVAAKSSAPN